MLKTWDSSLAKKAYELKILGHGQKVIIGGENIAANELPEIAKDLSKLLRLLAKIPADFFQNNKKLMFETLGFRAEEVDLLTKFPEKVDSDVFARADMVRVNGKWKLLEFNIGSTVGAHFFPSLPRLAGYNQSYDVLKKWSQRLVEKWPPQKHLAFIVDQQFLDVARGPLSLLAKEVSSWSSVQVSVLGHLEVKLQGQQLVDLQGLPIDMIHRHFDEHLILPRIHEYQDILQAIFNGYVQAPMSPSYNLIGNKALLAFLWEKSAALSQEDQQLVKSILPMTTLSSRENHQLWLESQDRIVIKPINDLQGLDVFIGKEQSKEKWKNLIDQICLDPKSRKYVSQEFCPPEEVLLALCDGESVTYEKSQLVWGVYIFGDQLLGAMLRSKPLKSSAVINLANGGAIGPLPPLA